MSDFRDRIADDDREVPLDDESGYDAPPTLDPDERIEEIEIEQDVLEERESAVEAGEIDPS